MRSCERPRKRSASEALPSSVSNRYFLSMRTHGSSCRRRASSSLRRVSSFSAWSSSNRAAVHSSRDTTLCAWVTGLFCTMIIPFLFRWFVLFSDQGNFAIKGMGGATSTAASLSLRPVVCGSRRSGLGLAHGTHFAAPGTAAVEDTGAVGLEAAHGDAGGHLEALQDFTCLR